MSINDIINPNITNPNITNPNINGSDGNKPTQPKNNVGEDSGTSLSGIPIIYDGSNESMKNGQWQKNAQAALDEDARKRAIPKFELTNGKVIVSGSDEGLAHPTVEQAKKALSDAFSGADFSDKDVAVAFQKALSQINEQIGSQFDYEHYQDFLKRSGFSDGAYQNYAVARQEVEKSNPTNSSTIIETYDKNGKKVRKSIKEWFEYWKKEYNPEDRGVMWRKSLEYAYNPTSDEDLYHAIPAILMGANYGQNYLQGFFQAINPFDGKDGDAPTITPIHGFEDTNPASVAFQSAIAEFGRILPGVFGADENPYSWAGYENGKEFFGIDNWDDKFFEDWSREDYQHWADLAYDSVKEGYDSYEKMRDEFGEEMARKMWMAYKFASRTQGGVGNGRMIDYMRDRDGNVIAEPGDYPGYANYHDMYLSVAKKTPAKAWDQNLQQSIERFANYNPNAATAGVMAGQIARIATEQAALSLVSGGALSASNIMRSIGRGLAKGGRALGVIKAGQEVAATSSRVARALSAMASGSADGLRGASRIIYGLGKASTWAAKELGEDALRGLIDDAVTGNSFDSQGNLDPDRLLENVYMNAIMAGFGRLGGTIGSGVKTLLNANKNIDGVKLTSAAQAQMNDLAKAVDGSDGSAVKGIDKDGHPVIIKNGKEVTLDKVVTSKPNAEKLAPQQVAAKDAAEIADEIIRSKNVSDDIKQKVAEAIGRDAVKGDTPAERFQNMPDSAIMTAISKTAKKFQAELGTAILNWRMRKLSAPLDALGIGAKTADGKTVMIDTGSYLKHNGLKSKSEVPAGIRDKMSSARSGGSGVEVKTLEQIADEATAATGVKYTADTVNRLINDYAKEYSKPITGGEVKQYFAENPGQQFTAWATGGGLNGEAKSTRYGFEYIMNKAGVSPDGTPKVRKGQGLNKDTRQQLKETLENNLSDEELREFIPNGKISINGKEMVVDTKNANMDDVASANGSTVTSLSDGIAKLAAAAKNKGVRSFQEAMLGIRAHIGEFATKWKTAVEDFAKANNVEPRDVILGLRNLRRTGKESIPGLKDLWEKNWAPTANSLLDLQDELTNVKTNRQKYYQRDMLKDTFNVDDEGNWRANQNAIDELLDGDTEFEITASSTAKNKGKIEDDSLETDPEILAKEFILSRLETIGKRSVNGKIVNTMYEAMEDGEKMTAQQASIAIAKNKATGDEVRNSPEVKEIGKEVTSMDNVEDGTGFVDVKEGKASKELDAKVEADQKAVNASQDKFNKAADKSTTAKQISENSGYTKRAHSVATKNPIGVNFMPGNPFKGFASWVNDNFVKSQSIQIDVDGKRYSVYSAGYSLYAEAASWARKAVLGIRDGQSLKDAIYNIVSQNGIKIEPSDYAKTKYNAMTSAQKDAVTTGKIYNRLTHNKLFEKAVKDDRVVDTELLGSMLTKEFKRQGASEFMRFLRKSEFGSFKAGEQKWLNSQAYKITASFDPKTYKGLKANIQKLMGVVMSAKYRSNMYGNLKNAQLQLTEIQRLFTLNKLGDFGKTVARLVADRDFRDRVSDAAYIYASDSLGQGLSKQDLNLYREALDSYINTANASTITAKGIITGVQNYVDKGRKAAIDGVDNDMLGAIEGAEYFKNYMLLAGILQSADSKSLKGDVADAYIRNRFNTEALAGTNVGRIGLVDSSIGRLAFMYLGFPIRELTLQAHIIKGGGNFGGTTKLDKALGAYVYLNKMLGAKGLVWALEAPWGYKFADVMGYDPFGVTDNRSNTEDNKNVDWRMRGLDAIIKYNPVLQGAVTSAFVDIYMTYREAYEDAKDEWLETHDDLSGFEWDFDDAPQDKVWNTALGFAPGYTAFNRAAQQAGDLDRGFGKSANGSLLYQTNTDPGNIAMGFIAGRSSTQNARDYYQTPDPIRDIQERGLAGLGRSIERAMPFRLNRLEGQQFDLNRQFREFDPYDTENYSDWFDGSFADQQQWTTGYYAFKQEAEEIRDRANDGVNQDNAIDRITSRENELGELRDRVERFVQAYLNHHPEGISNAKMGQIQSIFNMYVPDAGNALDRVLGDYSDYEKNYAQNRVAAGNFPAPYGMNAPYADSKTGQETGDYSFAQSAQLKDALSKNQYGIQSNAARVMQQLDNLLVATPYGSMKFKDYRDVVNDNISAQYDSGRPDYDAIANLQEQYLEVFDRVIRPVFETYGSTLLKAGYKSDIMQQFTAMLNGLIPSDEYRIDKKGRRIRQSTPYMRVDIKKWLQKNYGDYPYRSSVDNDAQSRLHGIEVDYNWGRTATARAKALALIEDVREGRAAISRENLEMLQNVLGVNGELSGGALLEPRVTNRW